MHLIKTVKLKGKYVEKNTARVVDLKLSSFSAWELNYKNKYVRSWGFVLFSPKEKYLPRGNKIYKAYFRSVITPFLFLTLWVSDLKEKNIKTDCCVKLTGMSVNLAIRDIGWCKISNGNRRLKIMYLEGNYLHWRFSGFPGALDRKAVKPTVDAQGAFREGGVCDVLWFRATVPSWCQTGKRSCLAARGRGRVGVQCSQIVKESQKSSLACSKVCDVRQMNPQDCRNTSIWASGGENLF